MAGWDVRSLNVIAELIWYAAAFMSFCLVVVVLISVFWR